MVTVQYQALATRYQRFNTLAWQVPPISIAAQSFLLTIALNPQTSRLVAAVTGLTAAIVGALSIHLY
jgi:hypothetical protein